MRRSSTSSRSTHRAAFGEINAPILDILEINASGRYDAYSSGQNAFSPKIGAIFNPIKQLTFTVDYFDIKKTGAITQPSNAPALQAYYSCTLAQVNGNTCPIPAGYNVIPGAPSLNNPGALPVIGFIESQLVNANTIRSRGLDFAAVARLGFGDFRFTSSAEASYILELSTTFPDGSFERYEGTLGNFNLTAGSGTPEWHGSWQNTLDYGPYSLSGTVQWFGGYDLSATDQGTGYKDCGLSSGFTPCRVDDYFTLDLHGSVEVSDNLTFYVNVLNALNDLPPIDPVTYGAHLYNAVQGGTGVLGRQFRAGARFKF
nr:TonB-dependent receptor [Sphingomonas parva]